MTALLATPLPRLAARATGFKLSPTQIALLSIGTGLGLARLAGDVRAAAVQALGYSRGPSRPPRVLFINPGARSGKTMLSAYLATHRALVCDLSGLAPGEECRVGFISASMRQARAGLVYAKGFIRALGLGSVITSERRDSFTIRRDARTIEFSVIRGNVGGDYLHGFWFPALVVHECAIAVDPSSGGSALDLDAVEKAVRPRLLPARGTAPGGLIIEETTSRDAAGPAFDRVHDYHGHADAPIVVFRATTLELRPDDQALREHVEAERATDPVNAEREFDCSWVSAGTSGHLFGAELLGPCIDPDLPLALDPLPNLHAWAGVDLAFTGDGSALAIVRQNAPRFELATLRRWKPSKRAPLVPSVVCKEILDEAERHGVRMILCDVHHRETLEEHARKRRSIQVLRAPAGAAGKEQTHADAQELLGSGTFKMGRDGRLIRSLQRVTATRTPDGSVRIRAPRRKGDHGDDASALVLALHAAFRHGVRDTYSRPAPGRVSLGMQLLGLVDSSGQRIGEGAIQFEIDETTGHARAVPGRRTHTFESNPSAGHWDRQNAF